MSPDYSNERGACANRIYANKRPVRSACSFCRTISRILFPSSLAACRATTIYLGRASLRASSGSLSLLKETARPCTDVRVLPLHFPVAREFIRGSIGLAAFRSVEPPPFGSGVSVRTSGHYPWAGVTCYMLRYESDRLDDSTTPVFGLSSPRMNAARLSVQLEYRVP